MEVLGILAGPITEVVKCSIAPLGRHLGYIFHYRRNLNNLKDKVEEVKNTRDDVELQVQTARRRGDSIKRVVEAWLENVKILTDETTGLNGEAEQIDSCFKGWCCARHHMGKLAKTKMEIVNELLNEGKSFSVVSDPALPSIESLPTGDFQDFESRTSTEIQIKEALKNEKISLVGVYGMGGVGKTTLMKELAKQVKIDLFNEVVMATVSQNPNLKKIQDDIAENLGMEKLGALESETGRAGKLSARLKKEKKVLIILDDLWQGLNLAMVGIPLGDDHKGCKIVITTRSENVCNEMDIQKKIKVERLSEQDTWNLFHQKAGDVVDSSGLETLAREVAKECGGLPLAIVTLGRALRDKDQTVWEDAARQLKKSIFFQGKSPVFSSVKLSYDYLESEGIQKCFLFCCFFPEDYDIDEEELVLYVMGEELLQNVDTLEEARGRLHTILKQLIASCLLLEGKKEGCVMMHDVVRDAALSIASQESNGFLVKAGLGLTRWPDKENLTTCKRISLIMNEISEICFQPDCPQLLSLSFLRNFSLNKILDTFFEKMTSLVTLDLSHTGISSIPSSLSCLVNLRSLCLEGTMLREVNLVGKLVKLEILSLKRTPIQRLPDEIGGLTNLKLLDLSYTYYIETVPRKVLSSLSCLEELYMLDSFKGWDIEEIGDGSNARFAELASLSLTALHLNVDNAECLSKEIFVCWENLRKFLINTGRIPWTSKHQRGMRLTIPSYPLSNWVKLLLRRTDELYLYSCKGLKNIVELNVEGFNGLKSLRMQNCHEIEYLVSALEGSPVSTFRSLEELYFDNMNGLEAIYHGPLPNGFLGKLKILQLFSCKKVINVLHCDLLVRLQNVEELYVKECDELNEVFQSVGLEEGHAAIPRLRYMRLERLPKLTTIWKGAISLVSFQQLKIVEVSNCKRLSYLFSRTMVQRLQQLEHLEIWTCSEMKKIIESEVVLRGIMTEEAMVQGGQDNAVLPRLKTLLLIGLPKLSSFYQQAIIFDWPSLEVLTVYNCPNLNKLPLGPKSAPGLRKLKGGSAEWFEGLEWEDHSVKSRLQPLFKVTRYVL